MSGATKHFINCPAGSPKLAERMNIKPACVCNRRRPSAPNHEHRCKKCKQTLTDGHCKFCRVTGQILEAIFEIEDGDREQAARRLRAVVKERIAGHVGWPVLPPPNTERENADE